MRLLPICTFPRAAAGGVAAQLARGLIGWPLGALCAVSQPPRAQRLQTAAWMVLQHGSGDPKLSCSEFAGTNGEVSWRQAHRSAQERLPAHWSIHARLLAQGKHRTDQRHNMFTSNSNRFAVKKSGPSFARQTPLRSRPMRTQLQLQAVPVSMRQLQLTPS